MPVPNAVSRLLYLKASNKITLLLKPQIWQREVCLAAISNLGIKPGEGYAWRGCRQQDRFLLLQNLHSRLPWRLQIVAPCKICIHAIPGDQAAVKSPWMDSRRSSTGMLHTLNPVKTLKLGIAVCVGLLLRTVLICVKIRRFAPFIWHY